MPTLMEKFEFSLLLIFTLSFYCLRADNEGGLAIHKVNQRCNVEERDALLDFKQCLYDPHHVLMSWDIDEDCCKWKGVCCSNETNHVIKLDLDRFSINSNLVGAFLYAASLHPSFFRLRQLQHLCLSRILFNQTRIPHSIGSLTELSHLDLSASGFIGEIPPHIGNLTKLRLLDLSDNSLVAYNLLWMSRLFSLQVLDMSNVILTFATNWLHEISVLPALSRLFLSSCNLQTLPNLLPYSNFSQSLGILTNLTHLVLCSNNLHGSLSEFHFANLSQLKYLDLTDNQLNFNMISPNWTPPFQIQHLYLSSCLVGPQFPLWLQNQKILSSLELSNCGISDIIPTWFWNISSQINYLNMSQNAIRGELPMSLNIALVATIDLRSNQLEGHLPQPRNFVRFVLFSNNKFSSGIELYLNGNMSLLTVLDLSGNYLSSEIPNSICQMPSIILLDLSDNYLSGEIPKCNGIVSSYNKLKCINMAYNNLRGSIPQWIGNLPTLLSLHINNNVFQGEMPFFKNCSKLITLDLGKNNLTGSIPLWIGEKLLSLKILRLHSNKFHGSIPSELSKLKDLQILDLANNFLSGSIPKSFKFLNSMDIRNKRLELLIPKVGHLFPDEGSALSNIKYHVIHPSVLIFDSIMINIKGIVRDFRGILSLVNIIDLSCNNLTGEVPIELMSLVGLMSLNLSRNQFTGQIPNKIGVMQSLESLDLSRNHFSGDIPESIVMLSALSYLNLSDNQLYGRIPTGTQLDTFNESSYYGNPKLCGKPLDKTCEGDEHKIHDEGDNSQDDDRFGLYLGMGLGFAVGLWSVLGTLLLKRSWATTYFQFLDKMMDNIYVFVSVKVNQWFNQ